VPAGPTGWLAARAGRRDRFRHRRPLAGAYGIAVSLLMAITTLLAALVAIQWAIRRSS